MNTKRRGLGRGLDALLGGKSQASATPESTAQPASVTPASSDTNALRADVPVTSAPASTRIPTLPVDMLGRGRYQPRSDMRQESLQDLADSIRAQGVVQPIVVRPLASGNYEIIAGERRWRAAQMAGLHEVPVVVRDVPDQTAMAMALIENIQREDLNPLEESVALKRLIEEFGITHQQAAEAVGRSRAAVSNLLRLSELNEDVKRRIEERELEMGHARALLALQGEAQSHAAEQVATRGLSVRETEQLVRRLQSALNKSAPAPVDPDVRRLEVEVSERIGASVAIQYNAKGKGKLVISYTSLDELQGILDHIQ
ncbi:MAG: ParB/RepB/Spo0J family partition protein [Chromatiales bacterium]|jgi:ParB family chromosome partitioning protein|nr:ParB/RepB/Spo0J family partition protein [Chromatiales bacterium]